MAIPQIQSAYPKKRYKYGEFVVTLLTDVVSKDATEYTYLIAIMSEGKTHPEVYITYQQVNVDGQMTYQVKVISEQDEHIINDDDNHMSETSFCEFALKGIEQMFGLTDETPVALH
jgi:hypothetical protein